MSSGRARKFVCLRSDHITRNAALSNFSMLVHGIAQMFETGRSPYPVERTLLTAGALSFLMESAYRGHQRLETPALRVAYTAPAHSFYAHGRGS